MEEKRPEEESVSLLVVRDLSKHVSQTLSRLHFAWEDTYNGSNSRKQRKDEDWDMRNVLEPAKKKIKSHFQLQLCQTIISDSLISLYQSQLCRDFSRVTNFASSILCVLSKAIIIYTDINAASRLKVDMKCAGNLADQIFAESYSHKCPDGPEKTCEFSSLQNHCHTLKPLCAKHELSELHNANVLDIYTTDSNSLDAHIAQPHSLHVKRILLMQIPAVPYGNNYHGNS